MFFTQINQLMNQGIDITLVVRKKEGQLTVSTMPKSNGLKDEAQNHIVPFIVTGTPEELDMGFIQAICGPVQKATGLLTNMSSFEQQAEKAAANSKAAKEQQDKATKEAKEKKEKFDKHMKSATDLESEKKYSEALTSLQQARNSATQQALKSVDEKIKAIKIKMGQGSLFDLEPAIQQPESVNTGSQNAQAQPVNEQPVQQPMNGYTRQNGQQPTQQPMNGYAQQNGQQPAKQPINGYIQQNGQQPIWQPISGNGQPMYQQPGYGPSQGGQPNYNNQPYSQEEASEGIHDLEPPVIRTDDPSAHREEEYDQYPDFPGYTDNRMYNNQNR